jgi:hypothetical protein
LTATDREIVELFVARLRRQIATEAAEAAEAAAAATAAAEGASFETVAERPPQDEGLSLII